jgi:hypothetical protein
MSMIDFRDAAADRRRRHPRLHVADRPTVPPITERAAVRGLVAAMFSFQTCRAGSNSWRRRRRPAWQFIAPLFIA